MTSVGCADCGSTLTFPGEHYVIRDNYYMASHRKVSHVIVAVCEVCKRKAVDKINVGLLMTFTGCETQPIRKLVPKENV